jgi:2-oxoglutarate dehydrogenase E1 component
MPGEGIDSERDKTCGPPESPFYESWSEIRGTIHTQPVETGVKREELVSIARQMHLMCLRIFRPPEAGTVLDRRLEVVEKGEGIDWATRSFWLLGPCCWSTPVR